MMHCAVFGYSNSQRKKGNVSAHFYRFPKDQNLCGEWVSFYHKQDTVNTKTGHITFNAYMLCAFYSRMFCEVNARQTVGIPSQEQERLTFDALPTECRPTSMNTTPSNKGSNESELSCLAFADDLMLLANDAPQAQDLLSKTETFLRNLGMQL